MRAISSRVLAPVDAASVLPVCRKSWKCRALAIRRADNGTWEFPGGVLELSESPEDGVAREVWEETGIRVEVDELTGVHKNTTRGIVALVFRCKPSGGAERTSAESTAVDWLTPEEVAERMTEVFAVRLLDALDGNGPHVRSHDGKHLIQAR
ncbi:NUDIX domain-containing protein [Streptomyces marokkonensis]|uniref:NUDIX domain-containing protein n=1 Tax=Streptomyces marokkonensis TaxID=324855 RepID=UPI0011F3900A|nr:NUDIX domain-containing protein [Streptomyces marokkonensis]